MFAAGAQRRSFTFINGQGFNAQYNPCNSSIDEHQEDARTISSFFAFFPLSFTIKLFLLQWSLTPAVLYAENNKQNQF